MFRQIEVSWEPIHEWPGRRTAERKPSQFRSTMAATYRLLESELLHLGCQRLVIQADCEPRMIRRDGLLRSDAKLNGPGIILSFNSKYGPLSYPCDTYANWDCNLRAIALALQALRAVDRYGVTRRAEQYRGWQQLPSPGGDHWTLDEAWEFIRRVTQWPGGKPRDSSGMQSVLRRAEVLTHPDRGGDASQFNKVQQARRLLLEAVPCQS